MGNIWFIYLLLLLHLFISIQTFRHFVYALAAHLIYEKHPVSDVSFTPSVKPINILFLIFILEINYFHRV